MRLRHFTHTFFRLHCASRISCKIRYGLNWMFDEIC